jgi:uncharacterized membrane protein
VAIPTVFGAGTNPTANTTKSFRLGAGTTVYVLDDGGTLTPSVVVLAPGIVLYSDAAPTNAAIVAAMKDYLQRSSDYHEGAGGFTAQGTKQVAPTLTLCT